MSAEDLKRTSKIEQRVNITPVLTALTNVQRMIRAGEAAMKDAAPTLGYLLRNVPTGKKGILEIAGDTQYELGFTSKELGLLKKMLGQYKPMESVPKPHEVSTQIDPKMDEAVDWLVWILEFALSRVPQSLTEKFPDENDRKSIIQRALKKIAEKHK